MSSKRDAPSSVADKDGTERTTIDSVHPRFRQNLVYCNICGREFVGNHVAIEKHFNKSHPSSITCCYCKGKVFKYKRLYNPESGEREPQEFIYHKCQSSS